MHSPHFYERSPNTVGQVGLAGLSTNGGESRPIARSYAAGLAKACLEHDPEEQDENLHAQILASRSHQYGVR